MNRETLMQMTIAELLTHVPEEDKNGRRNEPLTTEQIEAALRRPDILEHLADHLTHRLQSTGNRQLSAERQHNIREELERLARQKWNWTEPAVKVAAERFGADIEDQEGLQVLVNRYGFMTARGRRAVQWAGAVRKAGVDVPMQYGWPRDREVAQYTRRAWKALEKLIELTPPEATYSQIEDLGDA